MSSKKTIERSIILFPQFENLDEIEQIRREYDPLFGLIKPHITLVFPFQSEMDTAELQDHLSHTLTGFNPFSLRLQSVTGDTGGYLFLNVKKGNDDIIQLQDRLYTGKLAGFLYRKLTYCPHLTVGRIRDEEGFDQALNRLFEFSFSFETIIDRVYVERIGDDQGSIIEIEYQF